MVKVPERRCVVCRRSASKKELLRFVLEGAELASSRPATVVWDRDQRAGSSGRALYVHPTPGCLSGLGAGGIWQHGFRDKALVVSAEAVEHLVKQLYHELGLKIEDRGHAGQRSAAPKGARRKIRI